MAINNSCFSSCRRKMSAIFFSHAGFSKLEKQRFGEKIHTHTHTHTHTHDTSKRTQIRTKMPQNAELAEGAERAAFAWSRSVSTAVPAESEGGGARARRRLSPTQVSVRPDGATQSLRPSSEQRAQHLYLGTFKTQTPPATPRSRRKTRPDAVLYSGSASVLSFQLTQWPIRTAPCIPGNVVNTALGRCKGQCYRSRKIQPHPLGNQ